MMSTTLPYKVPGAVPGEYTDTDMCAGETVFGDHEILISRVTKLLESTQKAIEEKSQHSMVIAARFHVFETEVYEFCILTWIHIFDHGDLE